VSAAQQAWDECCNFAQQITADLDAAVRTCTDKINDAARMRFKKNPSGWDGFKAGFKSLITDSAGGLAKLSGVLKTVSAVAGTFLCNGMTHFVNDVASFGNAAFQHPGNLAAMSGGMVLFTVSSGLEGGGVALDCTGSAPSSASRSTSPAPSA
jgi:hypothetical protein